MEVLSLGLGFCTTSNYNLFDTIKDLNLFTRKLILKCLHHKNHDSSAGLQELMKLSQTDCQALRELLLEESTDMPSTPTPLLEALESISPAPETPEITSTDSFEQSEYPTQLLQNIKIKSRVFPPNHLNKNVWLFLKMVISEIEHLPRDVFITTQNLSSP